MNLVRTGTSAVIGGISGGLATMPQTVMLPLFNNVGYDALAEAAGLVVGSAVQIFMPGSQFASVADGLVDGSIALLARRGVHMALTPHATAHWQQAGAWRANGAIRDSHYGNVQSGSRGDVYSGNQSRVAVVG